MEGSSRVLQHGNLKILFYSKKHAYLSVFAVMFCKQFLAYTVHIDGCNHAIHTHSSRSQHISVLTTSTFSHLCFDNFTPLNLHCLRRRRGCIVVPSRVDI